MDKSEHSVIFSPHSNNQFLHYKASVSVFIPHLWVPNLNLIDISECFIILGLLLLFNKNLKSLWFIDFIWTIEQ